MQQLSFCRCIPYHHNKHPTNLVQLAIEGLPQAKACVLTLVAMPCTRRLKPAATENSRLHKKGLSFYKVKT